MSHYYTLLQPNHSSRLSPSPNPKSIYSSLFTLPHSSPFAACKIGSASEDCPTGAAPDSLICSMNSACPLSSSSGDRATYGVYMCRGSYEFVEGCAQGFPLISDRFSDPRIFSLRVYILKERNQKQHHERSIRYRTSHDVR